MKIAKDDQIYVAISLASYYGLRRSEAIGVKWSNIDFDAKQINIWHKVLKKTKLEVMNLKFDKKVLEELFAKRMSKYPDALTYDDIAKITGRARKFVYKWVLDGRIKAIPLNERVNIVPKQWLLDYMLTDDFIYNYASCNRLKPILNQAVIER